MYHFSQTRILSSNSYMDGYMCGEAMGQAAAGELVEQDFDLI